MGIDFLGDLFHSDALGAPEVNSVCRREAERGISWSTNVAILSFKMNRRAAGLHGAIFCNEVMIFPAAQQRLKGSSGCFLLSSPCSNDLFIAAVCSSLGCNTSPCSLVLCLNGGVVPFAFCRTAAMAILFAVVARGTTILAKHAWCGGNFLEVTEQILAKIPSENNKLTYSHGSYLFHYICQDRIIYLCITDDDFERSRAFTFLNEIKKRFQTTYGSRAQTALPYAMNSEFSSVLAAQLKYHSESKGPDQVAETQAQIDELKGIMVRNIDLVAQRGEKLELLIDKTENLVDSSVTFKTTSRNLARAMCMKNLKLTIVIIIVSIVILYIILSAVCGGLAWPSCVQK